MPKLRPRAFAAPPESYFNMMQLTLCALYEEDINVKKKCVGLVLAMSIAIMIMGTDIAAGIDGLGNNTLTNRPDAAEDMPEAFSEGQFDGKGTLHLSVTSDEIGAPLNAEVKVNGENAALIGAFSEIDVDNGTEKHEMIFWCREGKEAEVHLDVGKAFASASFTIPAGDGIKAYGLADESGETAGCAVECGGIYFAMMNVGKGGEKLWTDVISEGKVPPKIFTVVDGKYVFMYRQPDGEEVHAEKFWEQAYADMQMDSDAMASPLELNEAVRKADAQSVNILDCACDGRYMFIKYEVAFGGESVNDSRFIEAGAMPTAEADAHGAWEHESNVIDAAGKRPERLWNNTEIFNNGQSLMYSEIYLLPECESKFMLESKIKGAENEIIKRRMDLEAYIEAESARARIQEMRCIPENEVEGIAVNAINALAIDETLFVGVQFRPAEGELYGADGVNRCGLYGEWEQIYMRENGGSFEWWGIYDGAHDEHIRLFADVPEAVKGEALKIKLEAMPEYSVGIIGGADGPTAIFIADPQDKGLAGEVIGGADTPDSMAAGD